MQITAYLDAIHVRLDAMEDVKAHAKENALDVQLVVVRNAKLIAVKTVLVHVVVVILDAVVVVKQIAVEIHAAVDAAVYVQNYVQTNAKMLVVQLVKRLAKIVVKQLVMILVKLKHLHLVQFKLEQIPSMVADKIVLLDVIYIVQVVKEIVLHWAQDL